MEKKRVNRYGIAYGKKITPSWKLSDSLAQENSGAEVLLNEQACYPDNLGSLEQQMPFFKTEFKPLLYNHPPHQHSWQTKAINTTFLASSLLGGDWKKTLCSGASHLQENRMERNMQYLLVTLEIEGEWVKVKLMWLLKSNSFWYRL